MNYELYVNNENKLIDLETKKEELIKQNSELYTKLKEIEKQEKAIKDFQEELKTQIKNEMEKIYEETGNEVIENQYVRIKYTPSYDKIIIDNNKLKTEYEEVYLDCLKKSNVKSSVRITIK